MRWAAVVYGYSMWAVCRRSGVWSSNVHVHLAQMNDPVPCLLLTLNVFVSTCRGRVRSCSTVRTVWKTWMWRRLASKMMGTQLTPSRSLWLRDSTSTRTLLPRSRSLANRQALGQEEGVAKVRLWVRSERQNFSGPVEHVGLIRATNASGLS